MSPSIFKEKFQISGVLTFETAFHIGSGQEGELGTDMGVLRDVSGRPVLPGSTLKGNFRTAAERLAGYLGLNACLLDSSLSGSQCVSGDEPYRRRVQDQLSRLPGNVDKLAWLAQHTCHICQLFGSPLQASRIFFSDGELQADSWSGTLEVRDGVSLDRDSETARHGLYFNLEVVHPGVSFDISIELVDPSSAEKALIAAVLAEWEIGFRLGGFTSRGLGRVKLTNKQIEYLDYGNLEQLRQYLISRTMTRDDAHLESCLRDLLSGTEG